VAVGVDGAAVEGKAAKTAVEACAVKAAAMEGERTSAATMEGERTRAAVPNHCESAAAESTTAAHGVRADPTTPAHTSTVPAAHPRAHTGPGPAAEVPTPVPAAATRGGSGGGKGDRRTDRRGGGKDHYALSEHGSIPP